MKMTKHQALKIVYGQKTLQNLKEEAENLGKRDLAESYYQAWKQGLDLYTQAKQVLDYCNK